MKTRQWLLMGLALTLAALALVGFGGVMAAPGGPEAQAGTVQGVSLQTFYADDDWVTTTTQYGSAVRTAYHNAFDLFVSADFSTTGTITVTPQFSADNVNWVDGFYASEGWVLPLSYSSVLTNASEVTNTTTSTATMTFAGTSASRATENVPYRIVLSADGGSYLRNVPGTGMYARVKIEASGAVTTGVELLVQGVLRNN